MTSDQILEIIVVAGAAYAMFKAGVAYTIWRIQQDLIALESGEIEFEEEKPSSMDVREFMNIEKQGEVFYAYGQETGFLTQANSLKELFTNIKEQYPNTTWLIGNDQKSLSEEEKEQIIPALKSVFEEIKE